MVAVFFFFQVSNPEIPVLTPQLSLDGNTNMFAFVHFHYLGVNKISGDKGSVFLTR